MKFDVCFTSTLERAWKTSDIALEAAEQTDTCAFHLLYCSVSLCSHNVLCIICVCWDV